MTIYITTIAALTVLMIVQSVTSLLLFKSQQNTIESLTNKLMVRQGHREYRDEPLMTQEKPSRKPQSFYDDPYIDDDVAN